MADQRTESGAIGGGRNAVPEPAGTALVGRSLGLRGAVNARDLGGYRTAGGRVLRRGVALRSDGLNHVIAEDLAPLRALGLRRVVDLRSLDEVRETGPDRLPGLPVADLAAAAPAVTAGTAVTVEAAAPDGVTLHHLPLLAKDFDIYATIRSALADRSPQKQRALLGEGRAAAMMVGLYRWFVTDPVARQRFAILLRLLAAPDGPPLLFHCSAGKDRTGWAAALVLTALGVDRETVLADYLLTNERSAPVVRRVMGDLEARGLMREPRLLQPVFRADPGYLAAAFDEVGAGWSDFDAFWRDGLGLDAAVLAGLRANLLDGGGSPASADPVSPR
ncbi:protein-tyrosine phosphatase [Kitasatospora sp. MAA19]|uniref:tyrosine-protein phosphatase n=1 Tax=Kitasatospora sp. MAA19 TaxID=3035090 RepID=UPI002472FCEC|nr:tyrosine-protein phosphatase [Kitasatospora sp. MAA19]MDH6703489.1 protein-tyrosine phosphatase [Kitasatospora sp. MAA19]